MIDNLRPMDPAKWDCIIVDLDGTIADMNGRHPRQHVIHLIQSLRFANVYDTFLVSGRMETYREATVEWLERHFPNYQKLLMRAEGDYRPDDIVKRELFERHIEPTHNVNFIFDDRPRVIRMWRSLGLPVIDVGQGIEF